MQESENIFPTEKELGIVVFMECYRIQLGELITGELQENNSHIFCWMVMSFLFQMSDNSPRSLQISPNHSVLSPSTLLWFSLFNDTPENQRNHWPRSISWVSLHVQGFSSCPFPFSLASRKWCYLLPFHPRYSWFHVTFSLLSHRQGLHLLLLCLWRWYIALLLFSKHLYYCPKRRQEEVEDTFPTVGLHVALCIF